MEKIGYKKARGELKKGLDDSMDMFVTLKECDAIVRECARLLSLAIDKALLGI